MECQVCTTTHLTLSKWKTWADDRTRISSKNCQKSQIVTFRFHYLDSQKKKKPSIDIIMCEIALELCTFTQKTKQFCIVKSKAACWLLIQGIHDNSWIYMTDIYTEIHYLAAMITFDIGYVQAPKGCNVPGTIFTT